MTAADRVPVIVRSDLFGAQQVVHSPGWLTRPLDAYPGLRLVPRTDDCLQSGEITTPMAFEKMMRAIISKTMTTTTMTTMTTIKPALPAPLYDIVQFTIGGLINAEGNFLRSS